MIRMDTTIINLEENPAMGFVNNSKEIKSTAERNQDTNLGTSMGKNVVLSATKDSLNLIDVTAEVHNFNEKCSIIVANNNPFELVMTADKLERNGLRVIMVKTAEDALELIGGILSSPESTVCRKLITTDSPRGTTVSPRQETANVDCSRGMSTGLCPEKRKFTCPSPGCNKVLFTAQTLGKHVKTHKKDDFTCVECGRTFNTLQAKGCHEASHRRLNSYKQVHAAYTELKIEYEMLKELYESLKLKLVNKGKQHLVLISTSLQASTFLQKVHEQDLTTVPVVVMSGEKDLAVKNKFMAEGAATVVREPLHDDDISSIMKYCTYSA